MLLSQIWVLSILFEEKLHDICLVKRHTNGKITIGKRCEL
jgi:hypothetical protein